MTIDGLGQVYPLDTVDTIDTSKAETQAADFADTLQKAFDEGDKEKLKDVCDDFEKIMLQMLYKQMKKTVPDDSFIEKSSARSIYEDMLDETLMENASKRGMGISDMMYKQLSAKMDKTYKAKSEE